MYWCVNKEKRKKRLQAKGKKWRALTCALKKYESKLHKKATTVSLWNQKSKIKKQFKQILCLFVDPLSP